MRRETRTNLIVIGVLLVLFVPGGIILFIKKLDPNAHRMGEPDPVRQSLPYMDPSPVPVTVPRVVPPIAWGWALKLARERIGPEVMLPVTPLGKPVNSGNASAQLAGYQQDADGYSRASVILWADSAITLAIIDAAGVRSDVETTADDLIRVPAHVRRDLQDAGFIQPPTQVRWTTYRFHTRPESDVNLVVRYRNASGDSIDDAIILPQKPQAAPPRSTQPAVRAPTKAGKVDPADDNAGRSDAAHFAGANPNTASPNAASPNTDNPNSAKSVKANSVTRGPNTADPNTPDPEAAVTGAKAAHPRSASHSHAGPDAPPARSAGK